MGRFIRILAEESGSSTIVESSYNPLRGLLYRDPVAGLNVRYLHLVRDGRNFIASERRTTDVAEVDWNWVRTTPVILGRWMVSHLLTGALLGRSGAYRRLRFEDFLESPSPFLRELSRLTDVDLSSVARQVESGTPIPMRHIAAGNRLRLRGEVRLQAEFAVPPQLGLLTRTAFWLIAGWLAFELGYGPLERSAWVSPDPAPTA
jgi:hypothetical protein